MAKKYISWRRVSTFKQGRSGLGLSAQKEIIRYFIERDKGEWVADYEECYTGKELGGCVKLHKAMEHAKSTGSVLIIAKSDRFRNTAEALKIYEEMGDGNIMFCDLPATDKFTLTLFFALAEREALLVSIRTKQALAVKKKQGCLLGGANPIYKQNRENKSEEQIKQEHMRKGETKRSRYHDSIDTKTFLRVLKMVQPEHCVAENPKDWEWQGIDTKCGRREQMLTLMKNFQENDEEGRIFRKWDFSDTESKKTKDRLCAYIQRIRISFTTNNV